MTQEQEIEARLNQYREILSQSKEHTYALDTTRRSISEAYKEQMIPEVQQWFIHTFAPVTVEFVLWILKRAIENGHRRLYFLARDSYLFYGIAQQIITDAKLNIECRYLHLSRYSLRLAEYASMEQEELLGYICARGLDVTFEKMMHRGGLTQEESKEIAIFCGYEEKYHQVLTYAELDAIKAQLRENEMFHVYVAAHSKAAYPNVMGYLRQEGLFDGTRSAIVDSGWLGTIQKSLNRLLQSIDANVQVKGYYFGLYETPQDTSAYDYETYYFGQKGNVRRKGRFSNCLFELVYSSPEGMTLGYEKKGDYYYPVKSADVNPNGIIIKEHAKWLECYLDAYIHEQKEKTKDWWKTVADTCKKDGQAMVESLLSLLMSMPIQKEVELYGSGLFCDDILESQMQPIAADLTYREIVNLRFLPKLLIMLGIRKGVIHDSAWIEGSIVNCGIHIKRSLRAATRYKYFIYFRKAIKK